VIDEVARLWILEFLNLQQLRFKLKFQVEIYQVFLWNERVSMGGKVGAQGVFNSDA
jgi:hypothetical protein